MPQPAPSRVCVVEGCLPGDPGDDPLAVGETVYQRVEVRRRNDTGSYLVRTPNACGGFEYQSVDRRQLFRGKAREDAA